MEKRRQRLQEQQLKRREELEQRRLTYEAEMNRKKEAQKYVDCKHVFGCLEMADIFLFMPAPTYCGPRKYVSCLCMRTSVHLSMHVSRHH